MDIHKQNTQKTNKDIGNREATLTEQHYTIVKNNIPLRKSLPSKDNIVNQKIQESQNAEVIHHINRRQPIHIPAQLTSTAQAKKSNPRTPINGDINGTNKNE